MKLLVLAVLLSIMQTTTPALRKAINESTGTGQKVHNAGDNKTPSPTPSPMADTSNSKKSDNGTPDVTDKNTNHPIAISKLPAVSVEKDWADYLAIASSFLLVIIGIAGVCYAVKTWKEMARQRKAMKGQLMAMRGQLRQMRKQAAEMEKQTHHLEGSVAAAQKSAQAARLSADVAARVSIPTLVIEKFEAADIGVASLAAMLQYPNVKIVIKNYGQTPALLKFWNIVFTCEELPAEPQYWNHPGSGIMLERDVIEPNQPYTIPRINS